MVGRYRRHFRVRSKIRLKRKKTTGKILRWISLSIIICGLVFLFGKKLYKLIIYSDTFEVRKIEVTGLETISAGKFVECLPDSYKNNLLLSYFINFKSSIKRYFPQIKHVVVKRKIPHWIKFKVVERKPIAYLREKDKFYAVDDENCIFLLTYSTSSLPEIRSAQSDRNIGVEFINCLLRTNRKVYKRLTKLCIEPSGNILIYLKDGLKVIWGKFIHPELDIKLKYLNDVMYDVSSRFSALEYIDLRLANENRVIVKPIK